MAGMQDAIIYSKSEEISVFTVLSRVEYFRRIAPNAEIFILPDEILFQRNFGRIDQIFSEDGDQIWVFFSRNNDGKLLRFKMYEIAGEIVHQFSVTSQLNGSPLANRSRMLKHSNGEFWLINGFYESGILRFNGKTQEEIKLSGFFGGDVLHTDIMEVSDGSLWIGRLGKLYVNTQGRLEAYSSATLPVLSSWVIFHESKDGYIWIAGIQGDVFRVRYNSDRWTRYNRLNFQTRDSDGKNWFIDSDGRVVFSKNEKWFCFSTMDGLIDTPVRLVIKKKGTLWVAGSHRGVAATAYFRNNRWHLQQHPLVSWGIDSRSVFPDRDGNLWFGASVDRQDALGQISGVLQLANPDETDNLQWKHHTQENGITQHNVYGIAQSPDGQIWIGGTNLMRFDRQRWRPLTGIEQLNEFVDIVHSGHYLWAGSRYYGLFRFDGSHWKQFTTTNGLPGNTIIGIYEENPETAWVITEKDIAWFDGNTWNSDLFPEYFRIRVFTSCHLFVSLCS